MVMQTKDAKEGPKRLSKNARRYGKAGKNFRFSILIIGSGISNSNLISGFLVANRKSKSKIKMKSSMLRATVCAAMPPNFRLKWWRKSPRQVTYGEQFKSQ
jgi:hypothetical protein